MALDIRHNVPLQAYNSMAIPALARSLVKISNEEEAQRAITYARDNALSLLVLGEGSNTIFEQDYPGLVGLNRIGGIDIIEQDEDSVFLRVGAGENWHAFVEYCLSHGWYGLENLGLIPGLVGAAPIQNIGAYGVEVKDRILAVDYLDIQSGDVMCLVNAECGFAYRESRFKADLAGKALITSVSFRLSKRPCVNISYPALREQLDGSPSPQEVFATVCSIRRSKLPLPGDIPNTGSFFKNPLVRFDQHQRLKCQYPELVSFVSGEQFKIAAAWMIESAGWKNRELNDVKVHHTQALVITNPHKRDGATVLKFARAIQTDIEKKFGIQLEIEPRIYS